MEKGARKTPKARSQSAEDDSGSAIRQYVEDCAAKPCQKPHGESAPAAILGEAARRSGRPATFDF